MAESKGKREPAKTLRDEFAMAIATGLTAHPDCGDLMVDDIAAHIAREAYKAADAMLKERAK